MFEVRCSESEIRIEMSSNGRQIGRALEESMAFLKRCGAGNLETAHIVLRELLRNAVIHGNQRDEARRVFCRVGYALGAVCEVMVRDEGPGFDVTELDLAIPDDPSRLERRGYALLNALADRLEFNESGNTVTAYVDLARETAGGPLAWAAFEGSRAGRPPDRPGNRN